MNTELKDRIERELGRAWPDFERDHPALARELGREWYVAEAQARLADDPAYRQAMAHGKLADRGAELLAGVVERVVRSVLGR